VRGFALEPWIRDGGRVTIDSHRLPRPGDLALCEVDKWGDIRRLLARDENGAWITGLDAVAGAREILAPHRVRGVVSGGFGAGGGSGRTLALSYPLWSQIAALIYGIRKAIEAPDFGAAAAASVQEKYNMQIASYSDMLGFPLGEELQGLLGRTFPAGASVLVAGSGAGGEVIHLARLGYRVSGFDFLPDMVRAANRNVRESGVSADLFEASTIGRMVTHLQNLLEGVVADPDEKVSRLPLLGGGGSFPNAPARRLRFQRQCHSRSLSHTGPVNRRRTDRTWRGSS